MNIQVHHEQHRNAVHARLGDLVAQARPDGFRAFGTWPEPAPQLGRLSPGPAIQRLLDQHDPAGTGVFTFIRLGSAPEIAAASSALPQEAVDRAVVKAAERTVRDALGGHYGTIVLTRTWDQPEAVAVIVARDEAGRPVTPFSRDTIARVEQAWDRHALEAFGLERRIPLDEVGRQLDQSWRAARRELDRSLEAFLSGACSSDDFNRCRKAVDQARDEEPRDHVAAQQILIAAARRLQHPTFAIDLPRAASYFPQDSSQAHEIVREAVVALAGEGHAKVRVAQVGDAYHIVVATERSSAAANAMRLQLLDRLPLEIDTRAHERAIPNLGRLEDLAPLKLSPAHEDANTRPLIDLSPDASRQLEREASNITVYDSPDDDISDPSRSNGNNGPPPAPAPTPGRGGPGQTRGTLSITIDIPDAGTRTFANLDEGARDQIIRQAIREASPQSEGLDYAIDTTPPGISVKILIPRRSAHESDLIKDAFRGAFADEVERVAPDLVGTAGPSAPSAAGQAVALAFDRAQLALGHVQSATGLIKYSAHDPARAAMHMGMQAIAVAGSITPPPVRIGLGIGRQVFTMAEGMVRGE